MKIKTVAVYSDADRQADFVKQADESYYIGPSSPSESYLVIKKIIEVAKKSKSDLDVELNDNMEDIEYLKILKFYLKQLNEKNFDYVFYIAGVDIHFNDRLGKLKISDDGIRKRDEIVTENFFSKGIPLCGVLGGGYNKDFLKLVELHSFLHQSCAKLL